jgi:hypothetical protein
MKSIFSSLDLFVGFQSCSQQIKRLALDGNENQSELEGYKEAE